MRQCQSGATAPQATSLIMPSPPHRASSRWRARKSERRTRHSRLDGLQKNIPSGRVIRRSERVGTTKLMAHMVHGLSSGRGGGTRRSTTERHSLAASALNKTGVAELSPLVPFNTHWLSRPILLAQIATLAYPQWRAAREQAGCSRDASEIFGGLEKARPTDIRGATVRLPNFVVRA